MDGKLKGNRMPVLKGKLSARMTSDNPYDGPYIITPNRNTQVLNTMGYTMTADVVVNPIPSNYGLVTWNGSVLTIS